ncbi:hypothetical protein BDW71DRAFT_181402 [Aspergillus fruticulosus]
MGPRAATIAYTKPTDHSRYVRLCPCPAFCAFAVLTSIFVAARPASSLIPSLRSVAFSAPGSALL